MIRISLLVLFFVSITINAQNSAIGSNEKLAYTASYNMSGVLTDLAEVTMETSTVKTSKATLLRLKCRAFTYSKWDSFFKIRDLYETYVSPKTLTPYLHNREINEGSYFKNMKYTFSHKTNTVKTVQTKKNNWVQKKTVSIGADTKDIISTLYTIRTFDLTNLSSGTSKIFTILFDREEVKAKVTYLGKETISTALGKKACYKLSMGSATNSKVNGTIWLSADENKIPVYVQFKIPVGTGELKLKSASGLKN
ncbi:DUF3108 domain-containing protein [Algibacter amylolyticus]|uniref:DUF3108 domain-containing protein n=1 Tax=Algibacter amylolyticus TaxID=1608400 RepID=A0A5M7B424_9FLAO|nr:DUF3108 domain-containing protein [Algibacter amylolyticus]KAA5823570.1 DUF3108 domain-containing protein [Algibacter amylolyticus]MBB5267727.1 uncharacterized membrane protein YciS (DUF1049 family) [Algibacter amylolyticus]TSJ74058.1 DUF3108 domain-containing protein [Algibacter amylolyticus]